ncbi:hypothetical protein NM208_g2412 [Fusarium decemcellulare]|uniref:Uncharacterized protein n=1 Tax=Fusarium decemcellulare TaxID=57161 RepID=A0ACC1SSM0_9HYPO|nr:hypothetical protein NM208_g2412 [Fusarium decemcellulare]
MLRSITPPRSQVFVESNVLKKAEGFQDIEQELVAENLIAAPPPASGSIVMVNGLPPSEETASQQLTSQQLIYNLFSTTQQGASAYNSHPAIVLAVEWMKAQLTDPSWQGSNLNSVIFSNIAPTPSSYSSVQVNDAGLKNGGAALLVKAIYNACTRWDDNINLDQCVADIATLNAYIWENKTNILIMWYRQYFNIWPTDNTTYVDMYKAVLCSNAYKALKQAETSDGTWIDANLEMFHHFAKLAACGATDGQINNIYTELTTTTPILDPSAFGEIYTNHWRDYEGWLNQGNLDFGDLDATNLDDNTVIWAGDATMDPAPTFVFLAPEIIQQYDYWKDSPAPSCLSASTKILMASGDTKAISEIKPGDCVASGLLGRAGARKGRTVAFVSKSERVGRQVYELKSLPGIHFTATHPLVAGPIDQKGQELLPKLQFVNDHLAASLNPTWQSFETSAIDPRDLIIHDGSGIQGPEFLYDIIFEPMPSPGESCSSEALPIYIAQASNGTQLNVLSEAPLIEWFPMEMLFMGNVFHVLLGSRTDIAEMLNIIDMHKGSLQSLLRQLTSTDVSPHLVNATADVTLDSILSLEKEAEDSQRISDLIEKLIMRLGRAIGKEISTGWLNPSQPSVPEKDLTEILLVHSLRRLSKSGGNSQPVPAEWTANINTGGLSSERVELHGQVQGHNTVLLHEAILLPSTQQEATAKSNPTTRLIEVCLTDLMESTTLVGGGTLTYGSQSILSIGNLATQGDSIHAVLEVELRKVPYNTLEGRKEWESKEQANYAACLGFAFGLELLKLEV